MQTNSPPHLEPPIILRTFAEIAELTVPNTLPFDVEPHGVYVRDRNFIAQGYIGAHWFNETPIDTQLWNNTNKTLQELNHNIIITPCRQS